MEIISYGKVRPHLFTCRACNATLHVVPTDIKQSPSMYSAPMRCIICPVCGCAVPITQEQVDEIYETRKE